MLIIFSVETSNLFPIISKISVLTKPLLFSTDTEILSLVGFGYITTFSFVFSEIEYKDSFVIL